MNATPLMSAAPIDDRDDGSTSLRVARLHVFPVKSCSGTSPAEVRLVSTGLTGDRQWMVVDEAGDFVTQRDLARMVLVAAQPRGDGVALQAPGMPALTVGAPSVGSVTRPVRVWQDGVLACDAGDEAARWLSGFLGRSVRLVHFRADAPRLSSHRWTGDLDAPNAFSDGYPILVIGQASLDALNERLAARGQAPADMLRFRPNLVLDGLDAHAEDFLDEIAFETPDGPVVLRLVKPCSRCPVPNIDLLTAERGHEPGDTLAGYRADPRLDGAITFGMNAVIVDGVGRMLRVGQAGRATVRF